MIQIAVKGQGGLTGSILKIGSRRSKLGKDE